MPKNDTQIDDSPAIIIKTANSGIELATKSVDELKAMFVEQHRRTAESLKLMAQIWIELESRGVDLSDFKKRIGDHIPKIATGILAPEAVMTFAGRPLVLRAIEGIPVERQRELANGAKIKALDPRTGDEIDGNLMQLGPDVVSRVFRNGEELPIDIQSANFRRRSKKPDKPARTYRVVIDRSERTLTLGRMTVSLDEVLAAMVDSGGLGRVRYEALMDRPSQTFVNAPVDEEELERLEALAKAKNMPLEELTRQAILAFLV